MRVRLVLYGAVAASLLVPYAGHAQGAASDSKYGTPAPGTIPARSSDTPGLQQQGQGEPGTGSISGTIYMVDTAGDVKKIMGNTVYLVKATDAMVGTLGTACEAFPALEKQVRRDSIIASIAAQNSRFGEKFPEGQLPQHLQDRARAAKITLDSVNAVFPQHRAQRDSTVAAVLSAFTENNASRAPTRLDAQFGFGPVVPGNYLLFARAELNGQEYQWWKPVTVQAGKHVYTDLDNLAVATQRYCVPKPATVPEKI